MDFFYNNFIADFFSNVIHWLYAAITNDYVLAILLVTLCLRAVLLPLDIKQRRQMRKTTALQGKMDKIKERYANNPDKQKQKIAELYKNEGINPFSSCLPLLLQMVFLFAFFGAVRTLANTETVNMVVQAAQSGTDVQLPSFLWIKNIWQPDALSFIEHSPNVLPSVDDFNRILQTTPALQEHIPSGFDYQATVASTLQLYDFGGETSFFGQLGVIFKQSNGFFLLPILSGVSSYFMSLYQFKSGMIQQQNKLMLYGLPIFSVYICAVSGTAFAIYWTFTNIISIIQQISLKAYFDKGGDATKPKKKRLLFGKNKAEHESSAEKGDS